MGAIDSRPTRDKRQIYHIVCYMKKKKDFRLIGNRFLIVCTKTLSMGIIQKVGNCHNDYEEILFYFFNGCEKV